MKRLLTALPLLGCASALVVACGDSPDRWPTGPDPRPSFEITTTGRILFEVSSFATTGDGTIIYDGTSCDEVRVTQEGHEFFGPGMVPETVHVDKHYFYKLGVPCRSQAGVIDVVGLLDGQYHVYASQLRINSTDRAQIADFPVGEYVTLAATADQGCAFREWRRDHPFSGSIVSTSPSISIQPEAGVTYLGVTMCGGGGGEPPPPPPPDDPCIICPPEEG